MLLGRFWRLLGPSWRLLGRSWPLPGRSWGAFGPPGELFFELFGSLFGAFEKDTEKQRFAAFLGSCFWLVLCGVFFALLATAVRERALKKHEHHMVFTVYGACRPFARRAKTTRNNEEKRGTNQPENTSKNEGRNGPEKHQKIGPKSSPNGSEIALARVLAPLGAHLGLLGAGLASLGGLLALLAPLGRLLERSGTEDLNEGFLVQAQHMVPVKVNIWPLVNP